MKIKNNIWIKIVFWGLVFAFLIMALIGAGDKTDSITSINFIKDDVAEILSLVGIVGATLLVIGFLIFRELLFEDELEEEIIIELIEDNEDSGIDVFEEKSKEISLLNEEDNKKKDNDNDVKKDEILDNDEEKSKDSELKDIEEK